MSKYERSPGLFTERLARTRRDGRPATLRHQSADPKIARPYTSSSRLNDGSLWARAAWAECLGLEPVIRWHTGAGEAREVRPWLHGATSARAYLDHVASTSAGGPARRYLADLDRRQASEGCTQA